MTLRGVVAGRAAAVAAALLLPLAGCAAPLPVTASPTFTDRAPPPPQFSQTSSLSDTTHRKAVAPAPPPVLTCRIHVVALIDGRRAPDTLGIITGRAVKSPPDTQGWLRSVVGGLEARGVGVDFDAAQPGDLETTVSLQTAWVTAVTTNMTANVVLHMKAEKPGAPPIDRDFRGGLSNINWASGDREIQTLVNKAFAGALDGMAKDLHALCGS
ncbi:MAG: hypothetical protein JWP35_4753 [Caulobacter sp.]|nr:hypothetical protein [Caulobacter sp.]